MSYKGREPARGTLKYRCPAMIVHEAFTTVLATPPRRETTLGKMRLSPIAQAIAAQIRIVRTCW
jgi:hypothetical protein